MMQDRNHRRWIRAAGALAALLLGAALAGRASAAPVAAAGGDESAGVAAAESPGPAVQDSIGAADTIQPEALERLLKGPAAKRPTLVHVGFKVLYRTGHIPGSRYAGPASRPEGVASLRQALRGIPRGKSLVLYCGCCPWTHCPNVRPAFRTARDMGFTNVKVLFIARDLQRDWFDRGMPAQQGER